MSQASWGKRPSKQATSQTSGIAALDSFVNPSEGKPPAKRLNADIPAALHARVKAGCALEGKDITAVLIELLENRFPE